MENISENYIREIFLNNGEKVKYKIGQSLSSDSYISGVVNYIELGEARTQDDCFRTAKICPTVGKNNFKFSTRDKIRRIKRGVT